MSNRVRVKSSQKKKLDIYRIDIFEQLHGSLVLFFKQLQYSFKQSQIYQNQKLFVTLSSVAIVSKWDEPEKIKDIYSLNS